jgi:hypothetical protein
VTWEGRGGRPSLAGTPSAQELRQRRRSDEEALAGRVDGRSHPELSSSTPTTVATTTTTTLPPCTQTVLFQGSGAVPSGFLVSQNFSVGTAGRLDVVVDWTFASSRVGVYVVVPAGQCTLDQFNARSCNFLLRSEPGTKPRKVSVPSIAPGNYALLIGNFATQDESVATQVILSSSTCPSFASAPVGSEAAFSGQATGILRNH